MNVYINRINICRVVHEPEAVSLTRCALFSTNFVPSDDLDVLSQHFLTDFSKEGKFFWASDGLEPSSSFLLLDWQLDGKLFYIRNRLNMMEAERNVNVSISILPSRFSPVFEQTDFHVDTLPDFFLFLKLLFTKIAKNSHGRVVVVPWESADTIQLFHFVKIKVNVCL